jgi:ribonuclease HI
MPRKPTLAQLLRYIAQHEALEKTRAFFPGLSDKHLHALLWQAASSLETEPTLALEPMPEALPAHKEGASAFIRIYSDGASRGNPGPAGAGALLEGEGGEVLERLGRYLGEKTNNQAEYEGALLGLRRAKALGATSIELLADSQLLIRQLQGRYRVKNPGLLPLYQEAFALLAQFSRVQLLHIPREKNQEADEMSNRAIDERLGF